MSFLLLKIKENVVAKNGHTVSFWYPYSRERFYDVTSRSGNKYKRLEDSLFAISLLNIF